MKLGNLKYVRPINQRSLILAHGWVLDVQPQFYKHLVSRSCGYSGNKLQNMNEYTFRFYGNGKHLNTRTFHTETIEDAYKKADNFLRQTPKYDDWECFPPKTNLDVDLSELKNKGTQRSPFGIGS